MDCIGQNQSGKNRQKSAETVFHKTSGYNFDAEKCDVNAFARHIPPFPLSAFVFLFAFIRVFRGPKRIRR
jgi:hypothetical protein